MRWWARSKMSTGLPVTVTTARVGQDFISRYVLDIDIHKNQPNIHSEEKLPNPDKWHGAELSVTIEGAWSSYRSRILKYLRQLAVITPYAAFHFQCAPSLAHPNQLVSCWLLAAFRRVPCDTKRFASGHGCAHLPLQGLTVRHGAQLHRL